MFSSTSKPTPYSLTNLSPKDNYVQVQTPASVVAVDGASTAGDAYADVYQSYAGQEEHEEDDVEEHNHEPILDSNGLQMYSWSGGFHERDLSAAYFWFACCCPCITVPQLEVRLGLSTFKCAVLSYFVSQITLIGLWLLLTATVWGYLQGEGDSVQWTLMLVVFFVVQIALIASRIASLRSKVRARFAIPGSTKQDFQLAVFHPTHAVYQIAKHLACDRVRPCAAPNTLPAYEV
ncbi:hypothetical protein Gpo141_00011590 [Globisporangium polare]